MKLWAGRFSKEADKKTNDFNSSIKTDSRMFNEDIDGSIAHASMLAAKGIISDEDCEKILAGLSDIRNDIISGELTIDPDAEDIHTFIEGELTSRIGDAGKRLHTGRSRNDQVAVDIRLYLKDIYVESLDAAYGFLIKAETVEDNIFSRYDKVTLLLKGMTIRKELEPERYVIQGFTTANVVGREAGTSAPEKEKYISELTDNDLYTQVTLKDCEFAVRKGSLTPVNDAYTLSSGKGFISKYPRLVRDIQGSTIYAGTE